MRVALLTPEHPSDNPDRGGLGIYVRRMARALRETGHDPEVFAPTWGVSDTVYFDGIKLHQVNWRRNHPELRFLFGVSKRILPARFWREPSEWILQANGLAAALEKRHEIEPFHLVQSADFLATGLRVRRRQGRVHAVRCSTAADLWNQAHHECSLHESLREVLERRTMRRADVVYAPSQFIAGHFRAVHEINVCVVRPPAYLEDEPAAHVPFSLPPRFLIHFGQLTSLKGSDLLAHALLLVWEKAPDFTMVWCGLCRKQNQIEEWRSAWGNQAHRVHFTGPLPRPQLYTVLARAEAAVLPSQVDNLPNTVIESLLLGVPVIGSRGASIDELVEDGRTGYLVPMGNAVSLSATLLSVWQNASVVKTGFRWTSAIREEMRPERAVARLLELAATGAVQTSMQRATGERKPAAVVRA
jgi:glycogen synthase